MGFSVHLNDQLKFYNLPYQKMFKAEHKIMMFPSPFNEDHFISNKESRGIKNENQFPSPFNEDHFISARPWMHKHHDEIDWSFRPLLTRIISYLAPCADKVDTRCAPVSVPF